jgi:hypothetical protein
MPGKGCDLRREKHKHEKVTALVWLPSDFATSGHE